MGYIHEPFNLRTSAGICAAPFRHWFTYVTTQNEAAFVGPLRDTLSFRYALLPQMGEISSLPELYRTARDSSRFLRHRIGGHRPIVKDPIALFSAPWLQDRFRLRVIVVVRHPAAFVNSIIRVKWAHPFRDFVDQPLLMRDWLWRFRSEIEHAAAERLPLLEQAILLWKLIYSAVAAQLEAGRDWLVVRHEDLSLDPEPEFRRIFTYAGLEWTARVGAWIAQTSARENPVEGRPDKHMLHRDSVVNASKWKGQLSRNQIERIRASLFEYAQPFYGDADW